MAATMKPLHPAFGVELDRLPPAGELAALLARDALVIVRNAVRDDTGLLALGAQLGAVDGGVKRFAAQGAVEDQPWHHVGGIQGAPARTTLLYPESIPHTAAGLAFVSMRAAWRALPEPRRCALRGLRAAHVFRSDPQRSVEQPLVMPDPDTGEEALFLGYHATAIAGMATATAAALLAELMAAATAPGAVYAHRFAPGDLVAWDNRALMHRACALPAGELRAVREIALD